MRWSRVFLLARLRSSRPVFVADFFEEASAGAAEGGSNTAGVLSLSVQEENHLQAAKQLRQRTVEKLWKITEELNILYRDNWTALANREIMKFQKELLMSGLMYASDENDPTFPYKVVSTTTMDGERRRPKWTFATSFLYSLSLITTVGR